MESRVKSWTELADEHKIKASRLKRYGPDYGFSEQAGVCYEAANAHEKLAKLYEELERLGVKPIFSE